MQCQSSVKYMGRLTTFIPTQKTPLSQRHQINLNLTGGTATQR